jgi:hypothetical protein
MQRANAGCGIGLAVLLGLAPTAAAQVTVADAEAYYRDPQVFAPAEPPGQAYPTRFPSLSADGRRLAFARGGQQQIVLRHITTGTLESIAAPGLNESARDFSLSLDGLVLAFASVPAPGKSSCGREVALRNVLTGTRVGFPGASCLARPSKPTLPQRDFAFGYASNLKPDGQPSPSNSYDLYRRVPGAFGKGTAPAQCLTCAQDPGDDGRISVSAFSGQPLSAIAYRENRNLWFSPDGRRLAFVFSVAYQTCAAGDADCGESGIVVVDLDDGTSVVRASLRVPQRNRFVDLHGSADGRRFVFSSSASLLPEDGDGNLDVYLYDLGSGQLRLLSGGLAGSANDPRIAGNGRYVTFWNDSLARRVPPPPDVQASACTAVFDPVEASSRFYLADLRESTPRLALAIEETRTFSNSCFARTAALREASDINHSGTVIAVATRNAFAAGDGNASEDVHLVANAFAREAIFDHAFD